MVYTIYRATEAAPLPQSKNTKMLHYHLQFRTPIFQLQLAAAPIHFNPIRCSISISNPIPPPRDIILDFGKYRGKMLGTLPSPYLKWISKNLRAGDTEHWARLADQVLEDPVYNDRVEWEFAEKVLNGDVLMTMPSSDSGYSSVDALLQISERFGWDNEDKIGWSKVKFELLGTSRGGRIPRISDKGNRGGDGDGGGGGNCRKSAAKMKRRNVVEDVEREKRREERRVRRVKGSDEVKETVSSCGGNNGLSGGGGATTAGEIRDRFPGRESLLRKAMMRRRGRDE